MPLNSNVILFSALLMGLALAALVYGGLVLWTKRRAGPAPVRASHFTENKQPVFLFDSEFLVDATKTASQLIAGRNDNLSEYEALMRLLERQFPDVRQRISELADDQEQILPAEKLGLDVTIERRDAMTRIALGGVDNDSHSKFAEIERAAQTEELALLRNMTDNAPQMIWMEDPQGELLWANDSYLSFCDRHAAEAEKSKTVWPGGQMFENVRLPEPGDLAATFGRYAAVKIGKASEHWFDITSVPQAGGVLHYATDANEVVRAELAKREFQQTLSKTFAQLATGLAIFDRGRKLAMFNPAMLDLTALPVEFLSSRPSIEMVMDRLREAHMLPEPKNYTSWREQFSALQAAAENGSYCDVWDLPDGQTFRVTGRPHPDGALAFLFEDISAEVLLTRRFRTEIETGQAVLDTLPEAIVVFSNANTLVMTNAAYDDMWGASDAELVMSRDLRSAVQSWKSKCVASPIWQGIEAMTHTSDDRRPWSDSITMMDGRHAICHAIPLSGGMTMVKFVVSAAAAPLVHKITMGDPVRRMAKT